MKILKNILYWLIWCTWGLPITLIGLLVFLTLRICGYKWNTFCGGLYITISKNWGGFEMGPFFLVNENSSLHLRQHERGHGNQWCFGPLFIFFVTIPSASRYWLREIKNYQNKTIYSVVLSLIFILISLVPFILGIIFSLAVLKYIGLFLLTYSMIFSCWLLLMELPRYTDSSNYPAYDDFWVEGWASNSGKKTYENYYENKNN